MRDFIQDFWPILLITIITAIGFALIIATPSEMIYEQDLGDDYGKFVCKEKQGWFHHEVSKFCVHWDNEDRLRKLK